MKENFAENQFHNILSTFVCFTEFLLSPQVKQWAIITYIHGIYELLDGLQNDLRLKILEN